MKNAINYSGFEDLAIESRISDPAYDLDRQPSAVGAVPVETPSYERQIEFLARLHIFEPDY